MKSLAIYAIAIATTAFANSSDAPIAPTERKLKAAENYNQLSFGPTVFWQHFDEKHEATNTEAKSNGVFGGAALRYEYVRPDYFYSGTDAMFSAGQVDDESTIASVTTSKTKRTSLVANAEQRFGYSFAVDGPRSNFSPFVGIGWYYTRPFANQDFSNDFVYATAGFKSKHDVTDTFALGVVGKALYSFYDRAHVAGKLTTTSWDDPKWGFEVDVPLTWHLNNAHSWDFTFEPYFQELDVSKNFMNAGGRLLASYNF
ncbi:MAG: hypothetical protein HY069_01490 [Chlamydiia bacterium]|nr:hypothetical protein [Chlamydiia bacterium]